MNIQLSGNRVDLYKFVFPPDLQHPTLAVIACIQPVGGSITAVGEMQCRWAARVWAVGLCLHLRVKLGISDFPSHSKYYLNVFHSKSIIFRE